MICKTFWPNVEGGMWVSGLGVDGGTWPFCGEFSKWVILWPAKAFCLSVEVRMWVFGLGVDGGTWPFCNELSKRAILWPEPFGWALKQECRCLNWAQMKYRTPLQWSHQIKWAKLWPAKAFCPNIEAEMWVLELIRLR
jgi:hypothetical protein